jgi:CspA family cold shock protein
MQGTIQTIRAERGFGFIRDAEGGDVFFHHTSVALPDRFDALEVGMVVEFEPESGPKGPRATKIRAVSETAR